MGANLLMNPSAVLTDANFRLSKPAKTLLSASVKSATSMANSMVLQCRILQHPVTAPSLLQGAEDH
jgi:hypothetical protein